MKKECLCNNKKSSLKFGIFKKKLQESSSEWAMPQNRVLTSGILRIGNNVVTRAKAVVTKNISGNSAVRGMPAKIRKKMLKGIIRKGIKLSVVPSFIWDKMWNPLYKRSMKWCGKNVYLRPTQSNLKGLWNMSVGNNTSIPKGSTFFCTEAELKIGNNVIFGPNPTIITGDHRIDMIGKFITDSHDKLPENDVPVVIEDDVWTGANITILKGVTIGRGSVIAAGAVVTKSCPPYSIIGGVPAKVLKYRFTIDEVLKHEILLYSEKDRLSEAMLIESRK